MTNHRTIAACASALLVMLLAGPAASQDYTKEQKRCIEGSLHALIASAGFRET